MFNIPPAIMGLTILAWGNSIGDLINNVAIAKSGHPATAITGCFAGPLFNILIGLGVGTSLWAFSDDNPNGEAALNPLDTATALMCGALIFNVAGTLAATAVSGYVILRRWPLVLCVAYVAFIVVSITLAVIKRA